MAFLGPLTLKTREIAHLALTKNTYYHRVWYKMYPYVFSGHSPLHTEVPVQE